MENKSVVIILVNWNQREDLIECLNSINNINYSNFSLILVDNNSTDGSIEEAKKISRKQMSIIKSKKNVGFARANNIGFKKALKENCDYVMLLNTDAVICEEGISNMIEYLEREENVAAISPKIMFYEKRDVISYAGGIITNLRHFSHRGSGEIDKGQFNEAVDVDFLTGCCMVIKSKVLENVGLFDEKLFMYFEDTDFSLRLKEKGHKIHFFPHATVWHKVGKTNVINKGFYYHYYMSRNRLFVVKKHHKKAVIRELFYSIRKGIKWIVLGQFASGYAHLRGSVDFILDRGGKL